MGMFSKLYNKTRFKDIDELGTVKVREATSSELKTVCYQKATPKKQDDCSTFDLLKDGKLIQSGVEKISAIFNAHEYDKKFTNKNLFATQSKDSITFYSMNGTALETCQQSSRNELFSTTLIDNNPAYIKVNELKTGKTFFINFETGFISESYKNINRMNNGVFQVWGESKTGSGLYFISPTLRPLSLIDYQRLITNTSNIPDGPEQQTVTNKTPEHIKPHQPLQTTQKHTDEHNQEF